MATNGNQVIKRNGNQRQPRNGESCHLGCRENPHKIKQKWQKVTKVTKISYKSINHI